MKWLVPISGGIVAILGLITGQYALATWAIIAAALSLIAHEFCELSEHAVEYGDAMMLENLKMSSELCDAKRKIRDLQKENERLKGVE